MLSPSAVGPTRESGLDVCGAETAILQENALQGGVMLIHVPDPCWLTKNTACGPWKRLDQVFTSEQGPSSILQLSPLSGPFCVLEGSLR
jgi:hypothetical protein